MTVTYVTTDITTSFSIGAAGDVLDVLPTGIVTNQSGAGVNANYSCTVDVWGTVAGTDYGIAASGTSANTLQWGYCGNENFDFGVNWVSPGWSAWHTAGPRTAK